MLNERKLTERELDSREVALQGLLKNKRNLVKRYGKDAEKVMYGIATKKAKTKVEGMNKEKIKELILKSLQFEDNDPSGEYLEGDPNEKVEEIKVSEDEVDDRDWDWSKDLGDTIDKFKSKVGLKEGHGLDKGDLDFLKSFVARMGDGKEPVKAEEFTKLKKILQFIIKSNILQDKTKDLSKGKVDERVSYDDVLDLRDDKKDLEDRIAQLYRDMEQEAEPEGGDVANRYANELDRLEDKLYRVMKQINDYDMSESIEEGKINEETFEDYIDELEKTMYVDRRDGGRIFIHPLDKPDVRRPSRDYIAIDGNNVTSVQGYNSGPISDLANKYNLDDEDSRMTPIGQTNASGRISLLSSNILRDAIEAIEASRDAEAKNQQDYYRERGPVSGVGNMDEEVSESHTPAENKQLKKISKQLKKSVKSHGKQAKTIDKIVSEEDVKALKEKLCKKGEAYRKRRMAAGEKSSAYLSGRAVKVCKGTMSGKKKKK